MGGRNYCSIPGCKTKFGKSSQCPERGHLSLFSPPKDEEELKKWLKAIQTSGKQFFHKGDRVCELHFTEDNITRYYETLLPDGTVWRIKKGRPQLKKGSIPIFPNSHNISPVKELHNSISPEKRKISTDIYDSSNKKKILSKNLEIQKSILNTDSKNVAIVSNKQLDNSVLTVNDNVHENIETVKNIETAENVQTCVNESLEWTKTTLNYPTGILTYSALVNNLNLISKPDWFWGISAHDEFIVCAKWNKDGTPVKRVIIDYSLKIWVFLESRAIDFNNVKISSIKDLSSILLEVDSYRLCASVNKRESEMCDGYILSKTQGILCNYCRLIGNWEISKIHNPYWINKGKCFAKHQILYEKIDILNKKNASLKEQLSKILKIKAVWKLSRQSNQNLIPR